LKNVPNGRPTPFPASTTKKWRPIIARYQSSIRKQRSQNTNRRTDVCYRRRSRDPGQSPRRVLARKAVRWRPAGAAQAHDAAFVTASAEKKCLNGWSAAATFEGEFSQVTTSYAGKGVVRYSW